MHLSLCLKQQKQHNTSLVPAGWLHSLMSTLVCLGSLWVDQGWLQSSFYHLKGAANSGCSRESSTLLLQPQPCFLRKKNQEEKCRHWFKYTQGLVEYVDIYRPFQWCLNHAGEAELWPHLAQWRHSFFLIVHSLHACIIPWIVGVEKFCYVIDFIALVWPWETVSSAFVNPSLELSPQMD